MGLTTMAKLEWKWAVEVCTVVSGPETTMEPGVKRSIS